MAKEHGWTVGAMQGGYRVTAAPPPTTLRSAENMFGDLLCSIVEIYRAIRERDIGSPWLAYLACRNASTRAADWLRGQRDAIRGTHKLVIPSLSGKPVTSYCEAAIEYCRELSNWLDSNIDYPKGKTSADFDSEWKATAIAKEAKYIYKHFQPANIEFDTLKAGIQLELSAIHFADVPAKAIVTKRGKAPVCPKCGAQTKAAGSPKGIRKWKCPKCSATGKQRRSTAST